jgi:hypothetical protein
LTEWWLATLSHFLLTAHWLKRAALAQFRGGPLPPTRDEHWFQTMVVAIGTLSVTLHVIASTAGLTLWRVIAVLAAGHGAAWYLGRSQPRRPNPSTQTDLTTRALELAATIAIAGVVIQWILIAGQTAEISGADAAHYHVPNAINLALGASPFDLPPTAHLYPMGSSTLAAWFLLPVQTPLFTDLAMVLPFLLLMSASGWLFRLLTSLSGLAWCTWMMLALFATPLFRASSLMSADLLFAGATTAFVASLLAPLVRRRLISIDVWLIALSLGLLLGSKATGIVAAVLFGVPALITMFVLKFRRVWAFEVPRAIWLGALAATIGAGGMWQLRNWWVWGSPIAPNGLTVLGLQLFPGQTYEATRTYLSVFGDMTTKPDYELWTRARHFIDTWLSAWYLPGLTAAALIPIDAVINRLRSARLFVLIVIGITGALMAWILIGAPWTSLEWTGGFSLRYALPWLALLPVIAWSALFPASLPWYRQPIAAAIAGLGVAVGALVILGAHQQPPFPPLPTRVVLMTAVALVAARGIFRYVPRFCAGIVTVAVVAASITLGMWTKASDQAAQASRATAIATGPRTNGERIFDTVIAFETKAGQSCDGRGRRFFVTNRFDEAGTLQGPRLRNQVFYAARDLRVTSKVRPPMGPCDYILTEHAIMDTVKGNALHQALNPSGALDEIGLVGDVAVMVKR